MKLLEFGGRTLQNSGTDFGRLSFSILSGISSVHMCPSAYTLPVLSLFLLVLCDYTSVCFSLTLITSLAPFLSIFSRPLTAFVSNESFKGVDPPFFLPFHPRSMHKPREARSKACIDVTHPPRTTPPLTS